MVDEAIASMGFSILADKDFRAPTLSVYLYPKRPTLMTPNLGHWYLRKELILLLVLEIMPERASGWVIWATLISMY